MRGMMIVLALALPVPVAFAEVAIINDRHYVGSDGLSHIVGEVQNNGGAPINQIVVEATLHDMNGDVMDARQAGSLVNTVMPGMSGPFDVMMDVDEFSSYTLAVSYGIGAPKSQAIGIVSSELSRDMHGNVMITGTVTNLGEITANTVSVVATLYDGQGRVAAVSRAHPEPDYLRANGQAFFLVSMPDKAQTMGINDYALVAESEEYAAVPEFPAGMTVLLAGSVLAYVAASRYSGSIIAGPASAASP